MGAQDDFGLWERELEELEESGEPGRDYAPVIATAIVTLACTLLIAWGQAPLGFAGLGVSGLILILWHGEM
jgi:hypothetical protein